MSTGPIHKLTDNDIVRLGIENGLAISSLPDDFCGEKEPAVMERLVTDLGMRATELVYRPVSNPEETDA